MLEPVTIVIQGPHDSGRTTLASLIRMFLDENGYRDVFIEDTPALPADQKLRFFERFERNKARRINIKVETIGTTLVR